MTQTVLDTMRAAHPEWNLPASVADLTTEGATLIYRTYWDAIFGDLLPGPLASCMFKQAINQGAHLAIIELQMSLSLRVDAQLGPVTIAAANHKPIRDTVVDFLAVSELNYMRSVNFPRFGKGWLRRSVRTAIEAFA